MNPDHTNPPATPTPRPTPTPGYVAPEPVAQKPKSDKEGIKSILATIGLFLLAPIIALSITAFLFQSYQVDGESMENTLQNHDRLIVDKVPRTWARITHSSYVPHRGDIIVFNQFGLFDANNNVEKQLIKRVVGLPGDRVVVKDGSITIYNLQNPGGFNPDKLGIYNVGGVTTSGNLDETLGPNEIFVCGDNRPNSADSRIFGPVSTQNIVGKLVVRVFPLGNAKTF